MIHVSPHDIFTKNAINFIKLYHISEKQTINNENITINTTKLTKTYSMI
jgi:hypothetical protein